MPPLTGPTARPAAGTRGRARRPRRGCAPAPPRPRGRAASTPSSIQRASVGHVLGAQAAGGERGRAEPDAGRVERRPRVERDRVVVADEPRPLERLGGGPPADALAGEVDEQQVVVGAAGDEVEPALDQRGGKRRRVGDDRAGVVGELRLRGLVQRDRDRGGGVVVRAALQAREDRAVDRGGVLARRTAASRRAGRAASCASWWRRRRRGRPARGARRRRSGRRCGRRRRRARRPTSSATCGEAREVDRARDRGAAAPDQLRPLAQRQLAHLVEVDDARCRAARRSGRRGTSGP